MEGDLNGPFALQRPATVEERARVRGCRNCIFHDSSEGMCRIDHQAVPNRTFCGQWQWEREPRVNWTSAFAGLELRLAAEADMETQLTKAVSDAETPGGRPDPKDLWELI